MRARALLTASATGLLLLVTPVQAASATTPVHAAVVVHKACSASASVLHPKARSQEVIRVSKIGADVTVTAEAHYRTTVTTRSATSGNSGAASVLFSVGRPTKGYKVVVSVTAYKGSVMWSCSTYFLPA